MRYSTPHLRTWQAGNDGGNENTNTRGLKHVSHFREAIDIAPDRHHGYFNLAKARQSQGDQEGASRLYQALVRINPTHAVAHNNLAVALEDQGQIEEAIKHYRRTLQIQPDFTNARQNLEKLLKRRPHATPD